jgi:hypothetical protein
MNDEGVMVRNTYPFKLKDHPIGRNYHVIPLKKAFGFIPEVIIVEKMKGQNNRIFVRAVLTDEELKKEKLAVKKENAKHKPSPSKGHTETD